jgi:predicted transcriptional regulator
MQNLTLGCVRSDMEKPADDEERIFTLFFELSNPDRMRILSSLQKDNIKLNDVARRLGLTATESFRHLRRLSEVGLIERMPDGKYRLTPYSRLVLETSAPLGFIARFREYFQEHDASLLPYEFRARLAELSGGRLGSSFVVTMNTATEMLKGAKVRVDAMMQQGLELHGQIIEQRVEEGVKVRFLLQQSTLASVKPSPGRRQPRPEVRWSPRICGTLLVTEKAAAIGLRRNDGTMSPSGFYGENEQFLRWASDLFVHEWEKAKPWYPS